jgi:hypothetical protein
MRAPFFLISTTFGTKRIFFQPEDKSGQLLDKLSLFCEGINSFSIGFEAISLADREISLVI